jgi:hypothetical protein
MITHVRFIKLMVIICTLLFFFQPDNYARDPKGKNKKMVLKKPLVDDFYVSKVANVWTILSNWGQISHWIPAYEWPGGSDNHHLYLGGIWVAAIDADNQKRVSTAGFDISTFKNEWTSTLSAEDTIRLFNPADEHFDHRPNVNPVFDEQQVSAEDTYAEYTDLRIDLHDSAPLGLKVIERTYKWTDSYNFNFIIFDYQVINIGLDLDKDFIPDTTQKLTDVYIALWFDADVASSVDDNHLDDLTNYLPEKQISYIYDGDDPDSPLDDTGDFGFNEGYIYARLLNAEGGTPHRFYSEPHSHTWWNWDNDPTSDILRYNYLSHSGYADVPPTPFDYRFVQSAGPFDMEPGDTINVIWATGVGQGLDGIVKDSDWAKRIFDAGYLAARAPDPPQIGSEKGTGFVKLTWDNAAELSVDPLTSEMDFEGYRLYKSSRLDELGVKKWIKLADFDLVNEIGANTGLKYDYIDSDVLDGFGYSYRITAYDRGDPESGLEKLESNIREEKSNIFIMINKTPGQNVDNIYAYPNPYVGSAEWDHVPTENERFRRKLVFANLPKGYVSINIFTLAGDFVDLVEKDSDESLATWNMLTQHDRELVSGIYLYTVESEYGKHIGKFVVIQ